MENFTKKMSTHPKFEKLLTNFENYFLRFNSNKEALIIAERLMKEQSFNKHYGDFNKNLIAKYPKNTFEEFCNIVFEK